MCGTPSFANFFHLFLFITSQQLQLRNQGQEWPFMYALSELNPTFCPNFFFQFSIDLIKFHFVFYNRITPTFCQSFEYAGWCHNWVFIFTSFLCKNKQFWAAHLLSTNVFTKKEFWIFTNFCNSIFRHNNLVKLQYHFKTDEKTKSFFLLGTKIPIFLLHFWYYFDNFEGK